MNEAGVVTEVAGAAVAPKPVQEPREHARFPLQFDVTIIGNAPGAAAQSLAISGQTVDVSMGGLSILIDRNITTWSEVTVLLHLPPQSYGAAHTVLEAKAHYVDTVYSSRYATFRVGLAFSQFKANGREQLKKYIDDRGFIFKRH